MSNFGSSGSQEVELNITPIIDCFTVLITFMLASAGFLSIGFFEASTPGNSSNPEAKAPDTEVVMRIKANSTAELMMKGKKNLKMSFNLKNPDSAKSLAAEMAKIPKESITVGQILLTAEEEVDYQTISEVMGNLSGSSIPVVVGEF
jgi:biopolymer transport protein ExbD